MSDAEDQLLAAGMSPVEAARKERLFALAEGAVSGKGIRRWFIPGRIEVLGKHTDYAGGRSLLCTAERGMCMAAAARPDAIVRVTDVRAGTTLHFSLSPSIEIPDGWGRYVGTVVQRLARNFSGPWRGADIAFAGDLPKSAGMSSSSVLVIAIAVVLSELNSLNAQERYSRLFAAPERFAEYMGCVENGQSYHELEGDRGVGTFGGSEDHTAILCCEADQLRCYSFCPVTLEESIRMPAGWVIAVGSSGVVASKTGAARDAYNRAALAARAVLECWQNMTGREDASLAGAVRNNKDARQQILATLSSSHRGFSSEELRRRFEHFFTESEILIPAAVSAVRAGDGEGFGEIAKQSQLGAERLLGNQVPETISLAASAREIGARAASAFGAGFGGSVWALIERHEAENFLRDWETRYRKTFPEREQRCEFFITNAGPGLTVL